MLNGFSLSHQHSTISIFKDQYDAHQKIQSDVAGPTLAAVYGTTVAPDNGFVSLVKWWLLAIPGGVALWRRGERGFVVVAAATAASFFAFAWSLEYPFWRAGWEVVTRTSRGGVKPPAACTASCHPGPSK